MNRRFLSAVAAILLVPAAPAAAQQPKSADAPLFPRAIVIKEHVEQAAAYERELAKRYETPAPKGENWFAIRKGKSKVLVVAGHATSQTREGRIKPADRGTGSLALMLHELADATILHVTHQSPSDPNFYDDNDFKKALDRLLAELKPTLVLDLHASQAARPYDMDFGTMRGKSLLGRNDLLKSLAEHLRAEGLANFSQDYFSADGQRTITRFVVDRKIPCIQCEASATFLRPDGDDLHAHRYAQLLQGLVRFVRTVDGKASP